MQFVLMMYGGSVLITELQEDHPEQDLGNLSKSASEVETNFLIFQVEWAGHGFLRPNKFNISVQLIQLI